MRATKCCQSLGSGSVTALPCEGAILVVGSIHVINGKSGEIRILEHVVATPDVGLVT